MNQASWILPMVVGSVFAEAAGAGTAKIAFVHHANQHLADNGALVGAHDSRPGYWATLDSHNYNGVPVDLHVSGTLLQSYRWMNNDRGLMDAIAQSSRVEIVGGSYGEHILPYTDEDINFFSLFHAQEVAGNLLNPAGTVAGWGTNRPRLVWIPERVWKMSLQHDISGSYGYSGPGGWRPPVVLLDAVAHGWYCPVGGDHDHHNIHQMWNEYGEAVLVAFICPVANENWLNPGSVQVDGGYMNGHLKWLRDHPDQQKICIYGDDWEKAAGVADWWDSTAEYDSNIHWASTQAWLQKIHVSEAAQWWGVEGSPVDVDIPYAAYGYLQDWTGGNYDYWYDDSVVDWKKESVVTTPAVDCGLAPDRNRNGVAGDYEDLWKSAVENLRRVSSIPAPDPVYDDLGGHAYPSQTAGIISALCPASCEVPSYEDDYGNSLARAGWATLASTLYELGWHDGAGQNMSGWQKNIINHSRLANAFARGARWLDARPGEARASLEDIDGDGVEEVVMENDQICLMVDPRGGRALFLFDRQGRVIAGNALSNWGGEGDRDDGGHPGLFHDTTGWNSWFSVEILADSGPEVCVVLQEAFDAAGDPSTDLRKTLWLRRGSAAVQLDIKSAFTNWTRFGFTPDLWANLTLGYDLKSVSGTTRHGLRYEGYGARSSGATGAVLFGTGVEFERQAKMASLAELFQVGNVAGDYSLWVYGGSDEPDLVGFALDGEAEAGAMWEWADDRGHRLRVQFDRESGDLYVATNAAGTGGETSTDHFVFISDAPGSLTTAPWGKSGRVAAWDFFVADENDNDYEGWEGVPAGLYSHAASATSESGVLEGAFDLAGAFGTIPEMIYVAAAGFATGPGGGLQWQLPEGNGDGNLDPAELARYGYVALALRPTAPSYSREGKLDYVAALRNEGVTRARVDVAVQAELPGGGRYPRSPVSTIRDRVLEPGQATRISVSHAIPAAAKLGSYRLNGTLELRSGEEVGRDDFDFDIVP